MTTQCTSLLNAVFHFCDFYDLLLLLCNYIQMGCHYYYYYYYANLKHALCQHARKRIACATVFYVQCIGC